MMMPLTFSSAALQGAGSKKTSGNKTEAAQQALAVYEATLNHLRTHGGLVNSVKPEYLLDSEDFDRIMEARTAAAAGNPEQEQALELWAPVEQSFGVYSTQAWNTLLLQVGSQQGCSCQHYLLDRQSSTLCSLRCRHDVTATSVSLVVFAAAHLLWSIVHSQGCCAQSLSPL